MYGIRPKGLRSTLFRDIMQSRVVIIYWHFGTTYRSHFQ